jgi:hypothetical protein
MFLIIQCFLLGVFACRESAFVDLRFLGRREKATSRRSANTGSHRSRRSKKSTPALYSLKLCLKLTGFRRLPKAKLRFALEVLALPLFSKAGV